jgi:MSHA biogenesis protein MshM
MYYDYFGFSQPPFKITPDTNLFYSGGDRGAILDALLYAILNGEGIVKVVGEVGSGKTMLCRMLEKELPENVEVVYLVNPSISPENTLHAIAFELKLAVNAGTSRFEVMNQLQKYLLQRHSENRQVVVFVEEAQSMPIATLEEIRLLSNLETQQSKLLQIVLFGQPELDEMIAKPEIRQLKERITYSFQLTPFKTNDIREYINTRVRACGYRAGELFDETALKQIEHYSKGLLRRINILADKSLLAAFAENKHKVTGKHTRLAARDSEFVAHAPWYKNPVFITTSLSMTMLVLVAIYLLFVLPPKQAGQAEQVSLQPDATENIQSQPIIVPESVSAEPVLEATPETPDVEGIVISENTIIESEQLLQSDLSERTDAEAQAQQIAEASDSEAVTIIEQEFVSEQGQPQSTPDIELNEQENPGANAEPELALPENNLTENQLLGLNAVYPLLDISDPRLSDEENLSLRRQLERLPPESTEHLSSEDDVCERCWSIIYRPVWVTEKL